MTLKTIAASVAFSAIATGAFADDKATVQVFMIC